MLCDLKRPDGFGFDDLRFAFFIKAASSRLEQDPMFCENMRLTSTRSGVWTTSTRWTCARCCLLECPELRPRRLPPRDARALPFGNSFEPWGTTAETHPEEHPLTSRRIERY